jgi:hypothetical protein
MARMHDDLYALLLFACFICMFESTFEKLVGCICDSCMENNLLISVHILYDGRPIQHAWSALICLYLQPLCRRCFV